MYNNITIPDTLKKVNITQINNIVFFNEIENEEQIKIYVLQLIESNIERKEPIFYIVSGDRHWYVIAQQREQIFNLNVSSIEDNIDLSSMEQQPHENLTYLKYNNTKKQKLQYSSGCCEMYCVLLPYLLTRCMFFNGITELKDLFIINKNNFTFQSFLYNGLCEKAFSADIRDKCYTEDKGFKDGRIELLEGQVKGITEGSSTCLLYNGHTTFQEIFLQYLNSEINYIQYMQHDCQVTDKTEIKASNMKGGFIYRYAIMMSNMSDSEYRKHLQEYFEKYLDKTPEKFTKDCEKCKVLVEKYKKFPEEYEKSLKKDKLSLDNTEEISIEFKVECIKFLEGYGKFMEGYKKLIKESEEYKKCLEEECKKYEKLIKRYNKLPEQYKKFTENLGLNETEKQFFKENFQLLLSRFNKLFLGNAVCNYSVVSTSHEHQYIDDEKYFQHLLNNYARLQGVPIEEDQYFSLEQEKLIVPAPIDQATIAKLIDNNEIIFDFNEDNSQLVQKINDSKYVNFICTFETQNNTQTNPEIHYIAAQIFKDKKGTITLLRTGQSNEKIDNNFKNFIKKALNKEEYDINIVSAPNQLSEQHNDVNMDGLFALTAIRNNGILDIQRKSILNEQNRNSEQSWVGRLCKSQQKTHSRENSF